MCASRRDTWRGGSTRGAELGVWVSCRGRVRVRRVIWRVYGVCLQIRVSPDVCACVSVPACVRRGSRALREPYWLECVLCLRVTAVCVCICVCGSMCGCPQSSTDNVCVFYYLCLYYFFAWCAECGYYVHFKKRFYRFEKEREIALAEGGAEREGEACFSQQDEGLHPSTPRS